MTIQEVAGIYFLGVVTLFCLHIILWGVRPHNRRD